jgi:hypothetical protein
VLHVKLDFRVNKTGIRALCQLPNLRKFLFNDVQWTVARQSLLLSAQLLPRLQLLGKDFALQFGSIHFELDPYCDGYHKPFLEQPVALDLEEICVQGQVRHRPSCLLPRLKALHLDHPRGDFDQLLDHFRNITQLAFSRADETVAMLVLQNVGRRLTKLSIKLCTWKLTPLPEILALCPHVTFLQLVACQLKSCTDSEVIGKRPSEHLFRSLQQILLERPYFYIVKQVWHYHFSTT